MMSLDSALRCGSGKTFRRPTPSIAPAKTQAKTITLTHAALMAALDALRSSDRQRHRELDEESPSARRELSAELPEVADGQRALERRELGADAVDLRLVLPRDQRRVRAGRRGDLPLRVARRAEPSREEAVGRAVAPPEPPHVREGVSGLPVLVLILAVDVVE